MATAVLFSVPAYVLDSQSPATVVGYNVEGCVQTDGEFPSWYVLPGSPFTSNLNILDTSDTAAHTNKYRVQPVLQVTQDSTTYTLDIAWSRPFFPDEPLFDFSLTGQALPILRSTYVADIGTPQTNGTEVMENTGPGQGLWVPNGEQVRFPLQYVENDDPVRVLENWFALTWTDQSGDPKANEPDVDYVVDTENGVVTFSTAPLATDYLRFDFRECVFSNEFLLKGLQTAVGSLSQYGINGYALQRSNNLYYLNSAFTSPDLADIVCKIAARNIRGGLTEAALRSNASWRDGSASFDPEPSRALEFLVQGVDLSEKHLRVAANAFIRSTTVPLYRGDFDVMFDMSQMSPVSMSMFEQFSSFTGYAGVGLSPGYALAFWV